MLILGKRKHSVSTLLAILVIFASKSTGHKQIEATNGVDSSSPVPEAAANNNEKDNDPSDSGNVAGEPQSENAGKEESPGDNEEDQAAKCEESGEPAQATDSDSQQSKEDEDQGDQPSASGEGGEDKPVADGTKQNVKLDGNNRKTNLNDANSNAHDESPTKAKRETRMSEFLGLPRDSSYFFDDLEPFINNNSAKDNPQEGGGGGRVARALPTRENKVQKSKLSGKKEVMDEEVGEEEEDEKEKGDEEEQKANEGDYDEDEDSEPDCQILTTDSDSCTSSTECTPSSPECSSSTKQHQCTTKATKCTQRKTTTKCTTQFTCTTPCHTTEESTRCPKICAKANRKFMGYPPTTVKTPEWDELETKNIHSTQPGGNLLGKKRLHSKASSGKQQV